MTRRVHLNLGGLGVGFNVPAMNRWLCSSGTRLTLNPGGDISSPQTYNDGYLNPDTSELVIPCPTNVTHIKRYIALNLGDDALTQSNNLGNRQFKVKWDGKANGQVNLNGGGSGTGTWNNAAGEGTFTFQAVPGNTELQFEITDWDDPPRNIRVWEVGHDAAFQAGAIFNPDWLAGVEGAHTLRFMDWIGTNNSELSEYDHISQEGTSTWGRGFDADIASLPRGSIPLYVVAALANQTGADVHYCFTHMASDDCVEQIATYLRDNITNASVVNYEYSNEVWNSQFNQFHWVRDRGNTLGITVSSTTPYVYYGYRASEMMKIVRDVYGVGARGRWRGVMGTQTVSTSVTNSIISGVNKYRNDILGNSLAVADLFDEVAVTGYYGTVPAARTITAITKANPGVVTTSETHGYSNGQEVYIDISANSGMTELNARYFTLANVTTNTFELSGEDTTGYTTFTAGSRRHVQENSWPRLYDASVQRNIDSPGTYTDKYQYAAEIIRDVLLGPSPKSFLHADGVTSNSVTCSVTLLNLRDTYWPAQKAIAVANGLDLSQYEGGGHFVGSTALNSNGGEPKFTEMVIVIPYREEFAELSEWMHREWFRLGGIKPSKFNESGIPSQFGAWPGRRFYPGDNNPLWLNVLKWNSSPIPKKFKITVQ